MTMNLFVPITKVDVARREVWGTAAEEKRDKTDEIFDYASSLPYFKTWSSEIEKATQGKSKFNLRSMHQPIAAGKGLALMPDDSAKKIDVGAKVVDDNEWAKVLEGVYSGFSIGGEYVKRWKDPEEPDLIRYTASPAEISLVDNPAMYGATFEVIKTDGTSELHKFAATATVATETPELEPATTSVDPKEDASNEEVALAENVQKLAKCYDSVGPYAVEAGDWDVTRALALLAAISDLLQSEAWKGEPDDVALLSAVLAQAQTFLAGELAEAQQQAVVEAQTQATLDAAIDSAQTASEGAAVETPAPVVSDTSLEMSVDNGDLEKTAEADSVEDLTKAGARHSASDMGLVQQLHDSAVSLGANCQKDDSEDAGDEGDDMANAVPADELKKMMDDKVAELNQAHADELGKVAAKNEELVKQVGTLEERLKKLEAQPEPRLPVLRVVKRDESTASASETTEKANALAALEKVMADPNISPTTKSEVGKILALEEIKKTIQQGPQKIGGDAPSIMRGQ